MKNTVLSILVGFATLTVYGQNNAASTVASDSAVFTISIPDFAGYRSAGGDTIYMSSGGGMPQGELISINWTGMENIKVRQCYKTSVEVSAGGNNHYDLGNFKHGYTSWQSTAPIDSAYELLREPEFTGKLPFPSVTQSELKAAAKLVVADAKLINRITTPYAAPCSVWYSGIIIEITGTNSVTKQPRKMMVIVELPISC